MSMTEQGTKTLDPAEFQAALARFASGVTIVTTIDGKGSPSGFTASAFSSLSLEPPLVLVCLDRKADCFEAFNTAKAMAISILAAGQDDVAMRFASKGVDKFAGVRLVEGSATRLPLIDGALAVIETSMHVRLDGGDHIILVGRVLSATVADAEPLLHYNRNFGAFKRRSDPPAG